MLKKKKKKKYLNRKKKKRFITSFGQEDIMHSLNCVCTFIVRIFFFKDKIISSVSLSRISQLETELDEKWFKLPSGDKNNKNALETEKDEYSSI